MFSDEDLPVLVGDAVIACIGPITAETAEHHGLEVSIMPSEYTIESLADAIVDHFSKR
jgi:uroporphyrinogen-III synthase